MPICRVAPSGISSATNRPMPSSTGPRAGCGSSTIGSVLSTRAVTWEMCTWQSPKQNGTPGFTSSTTARARSIAAIV